MLACANSIKTKAPIKETLELSQEVEGCMAILLKRPCGNVRKIGENTLQKEELGR